MDTNVSGVVGNANLAAVASGVVPSRSPASERAPLPEAVAKSGAKVAPTPSHQTLQQAVDKANKALQAKAPNELAFSVDKGTGEYVVKMIDQQTGKTIRQIPSQEMLDIAESIGQTTGAVIKQQA